MSNVRFTADGTIKSIVQESANVYIVHITSNNQSMPKTWPVTEQVARTLRIGGSVTLEITIDT